MYLEHISGRIVHVFEDQFVRFIHGNRQTAAIELAQVQGDGDRVTGLFVLGFVFKLPVLILLDAVGNFPLKKKMSKSEMPGREIRRRA
jgi:hypothetical protein